MANPSHRMQWVSRAGPSRICVTLSPSPTAISTFSSATSRPVKTSSQCPPCSSGPMIGMRRTISQPGWSRSNRNALSPRRGSSEVRAIRMKCWAAPAPVMNHLRPSITQRPSRRSALVRIMPGSEPPPGAGSVMANAGAHAPVHDRRQPSVPLRLTAHRREQHHVAVVRGRGVEDHRTEDRAVGLLVHDCHAEPGEPHPAERPRRLRRPQAGRPGLGAQRLQAIQANVLVLVPGRPVGLDRQHRPGDELARALPQTLELGRQGEVHGGDLSV